TETATDTFTVTSLDGTTSKLVTIIIQGVNDPAVIGGADTKSLTEGDTAAAISTSGQLTVSDVDSPATFQAQSNTAGAYGSFSIDASGAWSYAASSAHDEFAGGQPSTDDSAANSADATGQLVHIVILGVNDPAVI